MCPLGSTVLYSGVGGRTHRTGYKLFFILCRATAPQRLLLAETNCVMRFTSNLINRREIPEKNTVMHAFTWGGDRKAFLHCESIRGRQGARLVIFWTPKPRRESESREREGREGREGGGGEGEGGGGRQGGRGAKQARSANSNRV